MRENRTTSLLVSRFLATAPSVRHCLAKGLINYSALARLICEEHGVKEFDAALVACRRMKNRLKSDDRQKKSIERLLRKAKVRIRNRLLVAVIEKPRQFTTLAAFQARVKNERGDFTVIEGEECITLITNSEFTQDLRNTFRGKILHLADDVAQIVLIFPPEIENTPGVVSVLYGRLSEARINVLEEASCWTDLMIIVEQKDLGPALKALELNE